MGCYFRSWELKNVDAAQAFVGDGGDMEVAKLALALPPGSIFGDPCIKRDYPLLIAAQFRFGRVEIGAADKYDCS